MEYRALFDETGGYDLMTGAWILTRDSDNCVIATIDQRDYGQKSCDFGYRSAEAEAITNRIVAALNTGGRVYRSGCTCVAGCDLCDIQSPSRDGRDKDGDQIDNPMALAAIPRKALDIIRRLAADPNKGTSCATSWELGDLISEARALADYMSENNLAL